MADQRNGGIAWTDRSWNCVRGCTRVDGGCGGAVGVGGCYAEKMAGRFSGPGLPYEGLVRIGKNGPRWTGVVKLIPDRLADPLRWRVPQRIFVNSMSDLFHEGLRFEEIAAVFAIMEDAPKHTFQILTKRPHRARDFFKWLAMTTDRDDMGCESDTVQLALRNVAPSVFLNSGVGAKWPLPNVWIGVSVHDQASADLRVPILLTLPAAVRFVSYEPAIEGVDFNNIAGTSALRRVCCRTSPPPAAGCDGPGCNGTRLDLIIVGGESGPGARPFDLQWARDTVTACKAAGVACFTKQLGANPVEHVDTTGNFRTNAETGAREYERIVQRVKLIDRAGADPSEWPADLRVREFPEVRR